MPRLIPVSKLVALGEEPSKLRNVCILAHVDHGKTTLADSLLAANGVISARLAGTLRYLDSRPDEQARGITMKASSVALYYRRRADEWLLNVLDSPGHIDFCGEVSTATRLSDGCLLLVDVVEGLCPQTSSLLRQALREGLKPVLVLNKIDRLATELHLSPAEAAAQIEKTLVAVNAIAGEHLLGAALDEAEAGGDAGDGRRRRESEAEAEWLRLEAAEEALLFNPIAGNVVFTSALDGWGFRLSDWAPLLAKRLKMEPGEVLSGLWGDFWLDGKTMKVKAGAAAKGKKSLFVSVVLDNIWAVYNAVLVQKDQEKVDKITSSLGIKLSARDQRQKDPRLQLQTIMSSWQPVAVSTLDAICDCMPPADALSEIRLRRLLPTFPHLPESLKAALLRPSAAGETLVFVSKMIGVEASQLPVNRPAELSQEELERRGAEARRRLAEKTEEASEKDARPTVTFNPDEDSRIFYPEDPPKPPAEIVFIGFARVFAGTIRKGQKLLVLQDQGDEGSGEVRISNLFLLMGRELESVESAGPGSVVGIGGLESVVLRSATLSSTAEAGPFCPTQSSAEPIVRVSVEPERPAELPILQAGLRLLSQADPCVRTFIDDSGCRVVMAAGEVHLERCIADLRERFCPGLSGLAVSAPIVPFQETVVPQPKLDRLKELILPTEEKQSKTISVSVAGGQVKMEMEAFPLPPQVLTVLERYKELLDSTEKNSKGQADLGGTGALGQRSQALAATAMSEFGDFREELGSAVMEAWEERRCETGEIWSRLSREEASGLVDRLWALGPRKARLNLLFNLVPDYRRPPIWTRLCGKEEEESGELRDQDGGVVTGWQLRCQAGPLAEEPVRGVGWLVRGWECSSSAGAGQTITAAKEATRQSFQAQPQRLVAAMYSCVIAATAEVLGKVYAVLSRRQGRVQGEEMNEGTALFSVKAVLPVVESFGFADEIRKRTSGLASPQLVFSHWEVLEEDPFWVPTTEEELTHFGAKADADNRARAHMDAVRRRKGLHVEAKIVEHAEKQRTLTKNK